MDLKEQLRYVGKEREACFETGEGRIFDAAVGAYLLNPLKSEYTYDDIAREFSGKMYPSRQELTGKETISARETEEAERRIACYRARTALEARGADSGKNCGKPGWRRCSGRSRCLSSLRFTAWNWKACW